MQCGENTHSNKNCNIFKFQSHMTSLVCQKLRNDTECPDSYTWWSSIEVYRCYLLSIPPVSAYGSGAQCPARGPDPARDESLFGPRRPKGKKTFLRVDSLLTIIK